MATTKAVKSSTGNIAVGKETLAQPYVGVTPLISGSGNVANTPASAELTPMANEVAYLCGFSVTGAGATAGTAVAVAVNGLLGGMTRVYAYSFATGPTVANQPLVIRFNPPLPGSGAGVPINITCGASGAGGLINCVNANGYSSTIATP